jgi:cytochrome c-type biogenesis protein CcmH
MTVFWAGVAGLVLLAWLMVWPAWRRRKSAPPETTSAHLRILKEQLAALDADRAAGTLGDAEHALARQEVQRRMLDETQGDASAAAAVAPRDGGSRKTLAIVGLAIPLFAVGVYLGIGNLGGLKAAPGVEAAGSDVSPQEVEAMLTKLSQRLEKSTGNAASDLQGWTMLGRSYAVLQRFAEADRAFARAVALAPNDAQLIADRADVLAMLQKQSMKGEPDQLIARALQIDPNNLKALALAGSSAYERKDFATARSLWQKARALAPEGSEFAAGLDSSLDAVRGASSGASGVANAAANGSGSASAGAGGAGAGPTALAAAKPTPTATTTTSTTAAAGISGRVSLAPALAARAAPTDTVFIFARAAVGPRMPLAILKRTVAELPIAFTLDDSMAMSPQMKLSNFERVIVGARISRSGNAMPQSGDLRGESPPTGTRAADLQLVIDGVQP